MPGVRSTFLQMSKIYPLLFTMFIIVSKCAYIRQKFNNCGIRSQLRWYIRGNPNLNIKSLINQLLNQCTVLYFTVLLSGGSLGRHSIYGTAGDRDITHHGHQGTKNTIIRILGIP